MGDRRDSRRDSRRDDDRSSRRDDRSSRRDRDRSPKKEEAPKKEKTPLSVGLKINVKLIGHDGYKVGEIKYMGAIPELPKGEDENLWLGVAMDEPLGKHDGLIGERRVFQCDDNCGVFVMQKAVHVEGELEEPSSSSKGKDRDRRRSRSRSRDRRRRRSRSRSEPKKEKKKSGFGDAADANATESATAKVMALLAGITKVEKPEDEIVSEITDRFHPTRKQRRLYICNLPTAIGLSEDQVTAFFNIACKEAGCARMDGDPIIGTWLSEEKVKADGGKYLYGFLEFRTVDETTTALALNGIVMQGLKVTVRRPNDYEPPKNPSGGMEVAAGPNAGLNMAVFGNNNNIPDGVMGQSAIGGWVDKSRVTPKDERPPSTALLLENMVTVEELVDDESYADIVLDTKEEAEKFGEIKALEIPRPATDGTEVSGVGKVYILFDSKESCVAARDALHGRAFDGRTVFASFCDDSPGVLSYLFKL